MRRTAAVITASTLAVVLQGCDPGPGGEALARTPSDATASAVAAADGLSHVDRVDAVVRRLWSGEDFELYDPSVSPDGRYASYISYAEGELAVRDLRTGDRYPLTSTPNDVEGQRSAPGGASAFSPDGARVAYSWWLGSVLQVRVLDFEIGEDGVPVGRHHRVVLSNPRLEPYNVWHWSPDGRRILALAAGPSGSTTLLSISIDDGSTRALKTFDGWARPSRAKFSPDGRHVVYDVRTDPESEERDLVVLSTDGTSESRLDIGASDASVRVLEWLPDGSVLFLSDRGGTPSVWWVPVEKGSAAGRASIVLGDAWNHAPIGVANGRYFFGVTAGTRGLKTAALDLSAGRLRSVPAAVEDSYGRRASHWRWAPDGRRLAYTTDGPEEGRIHLVLRLPDGDGEQRFALDLQYVVDLQWWPDGGSVLVSGAGDSNPEGTYRFDIATGTLHPVLLDRDLRVTRAYWSAFDVSPDGGTLFLTTREEGEGAPVRLTARDLATGAERYLAAVAWRTKVASSPDGMSLAVFGYAADDGERHTLSVVPAAGGDARPLYTLPEGQYFRSVDWTPDGGTLLFGTMSGSSLNSPDCCALYAISAAGGEPRRIEGIEALSPLSSGVQVDADGQRLAFEAGQRLMEIWVMEGLVPLGGSR